jgi:hypothetical protein
MRSRDDARATLRYFVQVPIDLDSPHAASLKHLEDDNDNEVMARYGGRFSAGNEI